MQPIRQLLPLTVLLVALTGCAQLAEQTAAPNTAATGSAAGNPGGFDHCTPDGSTCYLTAEDLARWGGHDHDEIQPEPTPTPEPEPLPESSTDLVIRPTHQGEQDMRSVPTPKTGTGWLWLACAVAVFYMFGLNGPNHKGERIRDEAIAGWNAGYSGQPEAGHAEVAQP